MVKITSIENAIAKYLLQLNNYLVRYVKIIHDWPGHCELNEIIWYFLWGVGGGCVCVCGGGGWGVGGGGGVGGGWGGRPQIPRKSLTFWSAFPRLLGREIINVYSHKISFWYRMILTQYIMITFDSQPTNFYLFCLYLIKDMVITLKQ